MILDYRFVPSWINRILHFQRIHYSEFVIRWDGVKISPKSGKSQRYSWSELQFCDFEPGGFLWGDIVFALKQGKFLRVESVPKAKWNRIARKVNESRSAFNKLKAVVQTNKFLIQQTSKWIADCNAGMYWVAFSDLEKLHETVEELSSILSLPLDRLASVAGKEFVQNVTLINETVLDTRRFRKKARSKFLVAEVDRFSDYFDTIESNPLTSMQRHACVSNEDATRVIAGAGSGKTSLIVAKAGYLLRKGFCSPDEILMLAFNKKAALEMSERIEDRIGEKIRVQTFHALGLSVLAEIEGRKPTLAKSAEDRVQFLKTISELIEEASNDKVFDKSLRRYFLGNFTAYRSQFEFETQGDYFNYIRQNEIRTLKGEQVKSYEECEIANYLFLNGIEYEYEAKYVVDTATEEYQQYQPDFYLPEVDVYLEHFAIDEKGNTPPFIDKASYNEGIRWKRALHQEHGTTLIETYSYQKRKGQLTSELEKQLNALEVEKEPITYGQALATLKEENRFSPFAELLGGFINHFKGGAHNISAVVENAKKRGLLNERALVFLDLFEPILNRYNDRLREAGEVDFHDMINGATEGVVRGECSFPWKYILVDEFQDISASRAKLVKSIMAANKRARLFCVGDDWQAIYRFAGSDISLMREFKKNFGQCTSITLDMTFRFNDSIENVASQFVQANPDQIPKKISTLTKAKGPRVFIHRPRVSAGGVLLNVLRDIQSDVGRNNGTRVMLLGRYRFDGDDLPWRAMRSANRNLDIDFSTVHSAKGMEADYVVVLGLRAGKFGFPSQMADDPLLNLVLAEPERYEHAEERRLFYVALTRAKKAVHLVADVSQPSVFLSELQAYGEDLIAGDELTTYQPEPCPECGGGELLQKSGRYGIFYSCSNYPLCKHKEKACNHCGVGLLRQDSSKQKLECDNPNCGHSERLCPKCGKGFLVERNGRFGAFLGCSNYVSGSCDYTEDIPNE